jgi:hypothetical protein
MKVLDLQCAQGHGFEGWFASEEDFVAQKARALVCCPLCGNADVLKKLSAPRLNLSSNRSTQSQEESPSTAVALAKPQSAEQMAAWLELSRKLVANTTDVGDRFAEEARKIHYGEVPEHAIRGQATLKETRELIDEGIGVMPLLLPEISKERLQ